MALFGLQQAVRAAWPRQVPVPQRHRAYSTALAAVRATVGAALDDIRAAGTWKEERVIT